MPLIPLQSVTDFATRLLVRRGVPLRNAQYIAAVATSAEAMGITTHGLVQILSANKSIDDGVDPVGEPKVIKDKGASALIDGENAFGQICMKVAKQLAVAKAKQHGIAFIAIGNTTWIAALGTHLLSLAEDGLCAFITCQTSSCQDCAPIGGIDGRLSTNPIALAFPTAGDPVVADFSTAAVAMGKVTRMVRAHEKAPHAIFIDTRGAATNDPAVVADEKGNLQGGTIMLTGQQEAGHKGYALSLWCEAMTALAAGHTNNPAVPSRQSFSLTVIDPDAFAGREHFEQEMKHLTSWIKTSRQRPGHGPIRLPGEKALQNLRQAQQQGLQVEGKMMETFNALAGKYEIPGLPT